MSSGMIYALLFGSRRWRRFSIAVDAHIRRRVLEPLTIPLMIVACRFNQQRRSVWVIGSISDLGEKKELLFLRVANYCGLSVAKSTSRPT